uniref:Uncharacterized protein n=2 Tax=Lygus hesperus TaxID=30085 RepID=A0A146KQV7_LYGHE
MKKENKQTNKQREGERKMNITNTEWQATKHAYHRPVSCHTRLFDRQEVYGFVVVSWPHGISRSESTTIFVISSTTTRTLRASYLELNGALSNASANTYAIRQNMAYDI